MRKSQARFAISIVSVFLLLTMLAASLPAQGHVVKPGDLQKALVGASQQRLDNIAKIQGLLAGENAQRALAAAGIEPGRIRQAVAMLDDDELARLAARASELQADFAAGDVSDRTMLYVLPIVAVGSLVALLVVMP